MSENFWEVWRKNLNPGSQNCILCLQRKVSMSFIGEKVSLHHSRYLFAKKHKTFGRKFMAFVLKKQSACPGEQFEGKPIFGKNKSIHHFRTLGENVSNFLQTKVSRVSILRYSCPDERFEELFPEKKTNFLTPPDLGKQPWDFLREEISMVVKTAFYVCSETSWWFSWKNLHFFSSHLDFIRKKTSNF